MISVLNLPIEIDIYSPVADANQEYIYSASGERLSYFRRWDHHKSTTPGYYPHQRPPFYNKGFLFYDEVKYMNNKEFDIGDDLTKVHFAGGYSTPNPDTDYIYIKDHQGNVRVVADKAGNVLERTDYFAFGMISNDWSGNNHQGYKYNSKEFMHQDGLNLYNYGARWYDPARAQFIMIDPLCEKYPWITPYAYCLNNPIKYVDPDGRDPKNPKHWLQFAKDMYNASTVMVTAGLELAGKIELNKRAVGFDANIISTDALGIRDGKFTPSKDTPQIRQGIEVEFGLAGFELSKSVTDNGNSTVTVKETSAVSFLVLDSFSETTTEMKETKNGYEKIKSSTENSVKASDLNVKAAVVVGVEINLDVNKVWEALGKLINTK